MPAMRARLLRAVPAVAALAALAGCGSVSWDAGKVQSTIKSVLVKQAGVQVRSVSCPGKAKIAKGVVTYCNATLADGETVRFSAKQTDGNGHVHVGPAEMIALEVQHSIQSALHKRGVTATASCPRHVPIVIGKTFVCAAKDNQGQSAKIGVTITDASAGFRMRILGS
jgi:hypothetical protein